MERTRELYQAVDALAQGIHETADALSPRRRVLQMSGAGAPGAPGAGPSGTAAAGGASAGGGTWYQTGARGGATVTEGAASGVPGGGLGGLMSWLPASPSRGSSHMPSRRTTFESELGLGEGGTAGGAVAGLSSPKRVPAGDSLLLKFAPQLLREHPVYGTTGLAAPSLGPSQAGASPVRGAPSGAGAGPSQQEPQPRKKQPVSHSVRIPGRRPAAPLFHACAPQ